MAAARRRQELEKPPHLGPVHTWEITDTFKTSVEPSNRTQAPGSWLKQWQKTQLLSKGCSQGYALPHRHLMPAPAIWAQGTGPMKVFQQAAEAPSKVSEVPQDDEEMDDADAMLFQSLLGPSVEEDNEEPPPQPISTNQDDNGDNQTAVDLL